MKTAIPIKHQVVRPQHQWRATTGLPQKQFAELMIVSGRTYEV